MLNRTYIGIFGPRNAGKSSLVNMLTAQQVSIVSPIAGTTTDPISKPIEINGLGPCIIIDTPGYDDVGALGEMRVSRAKETLRKCDMSIFVIPDTYFSCIDKLQETSEWYKLISASTKAIIAINCFQSDTDIESDIIKKHFNTEEYIFINTKDNIGRDILLEKLNKVQTTINSDLTIVTHLVQPGDAVMLVMPQDKQAPKGRLILPQMQTIRELLDYGCTIICCTTERVQQTIAKLAKPPVLIVTDSQVFKEVYALKPAESRLTSFSVLFARWKGDIDEFVKGAEAFSSLTSDSRVLIAEACTHAPLSEDIGREKIPALIHRNIDPRIHIDITSGYDWPKNVKSYDLIIHCGACMFNRTQTLKRIKEIKQNNIPITNYGIAIAYFNSILDKITW